MSENVIEDAIVDQASDEKEVPQLSLQDIATAMALLNIAIKRGAYEPNELKSVGETFTKIQDFLSAQVDIQELNKGNE